MTVRRFQSQAFIMDVVNTVVQTSALTSLSLIKPSHYDFLRNCLAPFIIFPNNLMIEQDIQ